MWNYVAETVSSIKTLLLAQAWLFHKIVADFKCDISLTFILLRLVEAVQCVYVLNWWNDVHKSDKYTLKPVTILSLLMCSSCSVKEKTDEQNVMLLSAWP